MQDGLGLVFEKQGNTGAAAYNQPTFEVGNNPLDMIAAELGQRVQMEQLGRQKQEKERQAANQQALNFDLSGADIDNKAYFTQAYKDIMAEGTKLAQLGYRLDDWSNPAVRAWNERKISDLHAAQASKGQIESLARNLNEYSKNPDLYDTEATNKNVEAYKAMTPIQRLQVDSNQLFVRKEQPIDILEPIAKANISGMGEVNEYETPNMKSSSTKFSEEKARTFVKGVLQNDIYKPLIAKGIQKGLFKNQQQYEDLLVNQLKSQFKTEKAYEKKAPPTDWSWDYLNKAGGDELMGKIGYGKQSFSIANNGATPQTVNYHMTTQLPNFNAIVGNAQLIDAKTGKYLSDKEVSSDYGIEQTGNMQLQSGTIVMSVVDPKTGKPIPLSGEKDQESIQSMIKSGKAEWKPMVHAKAYTKTQDGEDKVIDVWLPADAALKSTPDSKAANASQAAYVAYQKKADELNNRYQRTATGTQNTQPKTYIYKNMTFTQEQIEKKAKESNMSVEDYLAQLGIK